MSEEEETRKKEMERKEEELEARKRKLDEREREIEADRDKKDRDKKSKEARKKERDEKLRKLNEEARENAERLKKQQKLIEEALEEADTSESTAEDIVITTPVKKKKKETKKKKLKSVSRNESSEEEEERKYTLQAKAKVPSLDKGMTYAKYKNNVDMWRHAMKQHMSEKDMGMALLQALPDEDNRGGIKAQAWKKLGIEKLGSKKGVEHLLEFLDKKLLKTSFVRCVELNDRHMAIRHQEGWSVDKYISEAQQIWEQIDDLGYSVPAPMKCATLIRGLNLTDTQVHLIASKLSIGAADLEDQVVEAIKAFTDTNRVLTKPKNGGRSKDESSEVNIAQDDALGYTMEDEETLVAGGGFGGACLFCKKKGHFKKDCPEAIERLRKIRAFKEAKGEKWISPKKYAEMKKAQLEKKNQSGNQDRGTLLTQTSKVTTKLYDEKQMEDDSEYESYLSTYVLPPPNEYQEVSEVMGDGGQVATCHMRAPVQVGDPPHPPGQAMVGGGEVDAEEDHANAEKEHQEVDIMLTEKEIDVLLLEDNKETAILDTGCARSTGGEEWIEAHIENLSQEDKLDVKRKEGKSFFRFGNGKRFKSLQLILMPVYIGGHRAIMAVDKIEAKIPLLISLAAMKKANTVIRTATDTAIMCGKKIKLIRAGGHYTISLRKDENHDEDFEETDEDENVSDVEEEQENLMARVFDDPTTWKKELTKLHSQLCHVPVKRVKANLERGGVWQPEMEDILNDIEKKCKVNDCRSRAGGQRGRRPVVSFPKAFRVGQSVAMDLKIRHNKKPILYMVDQFSRFTLGVVLRDKQLTTVTEAVITHWIGAGYPRMKNIHTDNGGDFCGDTSNKVASIIGATRTTTAGRTPYQNGMCERIHQVLDHMMERVMEEDPKIPEKVALAWAVNAHNNMNMETGYSPRFLMFGEAQDLPGIWTAGPAGLEEMDLPERVANHLHAREIARKVQVQADTCIRLRRALRANVRPTGDKKEVGSWVYMKRMEDREWKGPGQVWSQLGTNIMVKQGATMWHARHEDCIRVREEDEVEIEREAESKGQISVKKYAEEFTEEDDEETSGEASVDEEVSNNESDKNDRVELEVVTRRKSRRIITPTEHEAVPEATEHPETSEETNLEADATQTPTEEENQNTQDESITNTASNHGGDATTFSDNDVVDDRNIPEPNPESVTNQENPPGLSVREENVNDDNVSRAEIQREASDDPPLPVSRVRNREHQAAKLRVKKNRDLGLRTGMVVKIGVEDGSVMEATLLKRTTKISGKCPNNFDVKNNDSSEIVKDVNFDAVDWHMKEDDIVVEEVCQVEEDEVHDVYATLIEKERHGEKAVIEAKKKELASIKSYGTYEEVWSYEVPDEDKDKIITTTWNVVQKDDLRIKARVCVRGFQEKVDNRRDSPTASKISQRLFISMAIGKGWKVHSLDVSAAFLQGDLIDRTVYVIPPREFTPTRQARPDAILWKLVRPLYGLTDASRKWYCRMDKELTKLGGTRSVYDHAVYNFWKDGQLIGEVLLHVDDLLYGGSDFFHRKVMDAFTNMFTVGSKEDTDFIYVGWHLKQSNQGITVSQDNYTKKVDNPDMDKYRCREGEDILDEEEQSHFRKLVGSINWLAMNTRPDLCFDAMEMACNFGKAKVKDIKRAGRILKKSVERNMDIQFRNLGSSKEAVIMVCADGSYGKLNKVDSCGGKLIALVGEGGNMCPITWGCRKFPRPARSALAAEVQAAADAMGEGEVIRLQWEEMSGMDKGTARLVLVTDSKSLQEACQTDNQLKDKRTAIDMAVLRRSVEMNIYSIMWRPGKTQLADPLTKQGACCDRLRHALTTGQVSIAF